MQFETFWVQLDNEPSPHLKVIVVEPTVTRPGLLLSVSSMGSEKIFGGKVKITTSATQAFITDRICGFHTIYPNTITLGDAMGKIKSNGHGSLETCYHEAAIRAACESLVHLKGYDKAHCVPFFAFLGCADSGMDNPC